MRGVYHDRNGNCTSRAQSNAGKGNPRPLNIFMLTGAADPQFSAFIPLTWLG